MSGVHVSGEYAKQESNTPSVLARNHRIFFARVHCNRTQDLTRIFSKFMPFLPSLSFSPVDMKRKSNDDQTEIRRKDATSLEYYISCLLAILGYARIWPVDSFPLHKMVFSIGATSVFILGNFLLLLSEIVELTVIKELKLFANIVGVICMHLVGLIKWCYCIKKNRQIVDIAIKLEKCHVLCQQIDNSGEGGTWLFIIVH